MEEDYGAAAKYYESLIKILKKKNTRLVDKALQISSGDRSKVSTRIVRIPQLRTIIPFVQKDPRAAFLVVSPTNLFTEDDPILRYLPTIKTTRPAYISWYEGTVIGDKPYGSEDTIDNIFISLKKYTMDAKINFFRLSRGKNPIPEYPSESKDMRSIFCNVCVLFGCGIHPYGLGGTAKPTETQKCICTTNKLARPITSTVSHEWVSKSKLKECVKKKIMKSIATDKSHTKEKDSVLDNCRGGVRLPIKSVQLKKGEKDPREFYEPCVHKDSCTKNNCDCAKRGTFCELACSCRNCGNFKYCSCQCCGSDCVCLKASRECTDLCGCVKKRLECANLNIYLRKTKQVSVMASAKHGYGLFSECFIKEGEFVIEYTGELISDKEAERRGNFYELNRCSYLFNLTNSGEECLHSIDAFLMGNQSKYINHSKQNANLKAVVRSYRGQTKIIFCAIRDIFKGEELLFDYKFSESHMLKHGIVD